MNDLARVQNMLLEACDLLFKIAGESDVPKNVVHNNRPKLTRREVEQIRWMKRAGNTNRELAEIYDVNRSTIYRIIRGEYHK